MQAAQVLGSCWACLRGKQIQKGAIAAARRHSTPVSAVLQNELVAVAFDLGGKPIPGAWVWEPSAAPPVPELRQALEMTTIESVSLGRVVGREWNGGV